jgi:UDP-N-acetylmuramoyl-tripeptide--D-alanyl-D-alanine ligase
MPTQINNISELYTIFSACSGACTDTRKIEEDSMFFCLKGANFDGNTFASKALESGAKYVVMDNAEFAVDQGCILVDDVLKTLQNLAQFYRRQFDIPVIGITGTNGKTTTKELIHTVLSSQYKTHATFGNLNNHIGVPLTILSMPKNTEIAIIEMGANHLHEIGELCQISRPNLGLITSIGKAHLEGFGSIEGVIQTKKELYDFIEVNGGLVFVPSDNNLLMDLSKNLKRKKFGSTDNSDIKGSLINNAGLIKVEYQGVEIQSQLVGDYNFVNLMAAIALGEFFGVSLENIKNSLENYAPRNQRSQLLKMGTNSIILDAYNANPTSMELALKSLENIDFPTKSVVLGDMLELGKETISEHTHIIKLLETMKLKNVVLIGPVFNSLNHNFVSFENSEQAKEYFKTNIWSHQFILVKGSRGIQVEKVLEVF